MKVRALITIHNPVSGYWLAEGEEGEAKLYHLHTHIPPITTVEVINSQGNPVKMTLEVFEKYTEKIQRDRLRLVTG